MIPAFHRFRDAELWISGTGGDEAALRRQARGMGHVRFLGYLPQTRLVGLNKQAIALIVPSLCFEIFPLVVLEAFREKTPILVRRIDGLEEIVEDTNGGLMYDTTEELVAAMARLSSDPPYRQALGELGHASYLRNWTTEAHLARYLGLIRALRENPAPLRPTRIERTT